MGLFEFPLGMVLDPNQMRALSEAEINQMQVANASAARQAAIQPYEYEAMRNHVFAQWPAPPEKPLDERFADFKIRLEAAVKRHRAKYQTTSPPSP